MIKQAAFQNKIVVIDVTDNYLCNEQGIACADVKHPYQLFLFYPAAFTPICTEELKLFSTRINEFSELGVAVYGISPDSVEELLAWTDPTTLPRKWEKKGATRTLHPIGTINFPLLSDPDGELQKAVFNIDEPIRATLITRTNPDNIESLFDSVIHIRATRTALYVDFILEYIRMIIKLDNGSVVCSISDLEPLNTTN